MKAAIQINRNHWLMILGVLPLFTALGWLSSFVADRYVSAAAFVPLVVVFGYSWFWLIVPRDNQRELLKLFMSALCLRIAATFILEFAWSSFEGSSDGVVYGPHAAALASAWQSFGFVRYEDVIVIPVGAPGYVYFCASIFWLFGVNTIYLKLLNGMFAAVACIYTYKIGKHFFGERIGIFASWLTALMPSMILWTSQNLKDSVVLLLSVWIIWIACNGFRSSLMRIPLLLGLILLLASVRTETALGLAVVIAVTILFQSSHHWFPRAVVTVVAVVVLGLGLSTIGYGFLGRDYLENRLSFEAITDKRMANSIGTGSIDSSIDTNSFGGFMAYLPEAMVNFLLRPWPWEATKSLNQLLTIPEAVFLWYPLFGFSLFGLWHLWRTQALRTTLLWVYVIGATIAAAPQYGNFGTAYRHRVQLWPMFFIFAAVGWHVWRDARIKHLNERSKLGTAYEPTS